MGHAAEYASDYAQYMQKVYNESESWALTGMSVHNIRWRCIHAALGHADSLAYAVTLAALARGISVYRHGPKRFQDVFACASVVGREWPLLLACHPYEKASTLSVGRT